MARYGFSRDTRLTTTGGGAIIDHLAEQYKTPQLELEVVDFGRRQAVLLLTQELGS